MAYDSYRNLEKRKASDRVLHNEALDFAGLPNYDGYQCGLDSMISKKKDKKSIDTNHTVTKPCNAASDTFSEN